MRILALLVILATCPAVAAAQSSSAAGLVVDDCIVKYIEKASVPAEAEGKLIQINFEEGSDVESGALLALIDNEASALAVQLKRAEEKEAELVAMNTVRLKDAQNSEQLARAEANSYEKMFLEGGVPFYDKEKKILEADRAELQIELAERQILEAKARYLAKKAERQMAENQLKKHSVEALFPGFVESREARKGEWVQPGTPIATIIQMDKLRVEGAVRHTKNLIKGTPVTVEVFTDLDRGESTVVRGTIDFIGSNVNLNGQIRIWVDISNTKSDGGWLFKPGMEARMTIAR